ncbi:MAG TPA: hypothetical protein VM537_22225 [Anaerolineae bacterium]|nr:hypothetical protein [Anaerolineae bacterium]
MGNAQMIKVIAQDSTGRKRSTIELPADIPIDLLIPAMVARLDLPLAMKGWPVMYELDNKRTGERVEAGHTLASAGIRSEDKLTLAPLVRVPDQLEDVRLVYGRSVFRDVAMIVTVALGERLIALAVPRQGTIADLVEYLRRRLAGLSPPVELPSSVRLCHEGRGEFLQEEGSVGAVISDQEVISLHEVIRIEEL